VRIPEGTSTLKYYAVDAAGNQLPFKTETVKKDTVKPDLKYQASSAEMTVGDTLTVTLSDTTDESKSLYYAVDFGDGTNESFTSYPSVFGHAYQNAGTYAVKVWVKDAAGNIASQEFHVVVRDEEVVPIDEGNSSSLPLIIGAVAAALVLFVVIGILVFLLLARRRTFEVTMDEAAARPAPPADPQTPPSNGSPIPPPPENPIREE
jgi:plastocyanin